MTTTSKKKYIYNTATVNGYEKSFVDKIFTRHLQTRRTRQRTTLQSTGARPKIISLPFYPKVTTPLSNTLRKYKIHTITRNNKTLRTELCYYKDKLDPLTTSGIYEVSCENCDEKYIGQTRRPIRERFKEHHSATEHQQPWKSSVAEHMTENGHKIDTIRRMKMVTEEHKLDSWESLFMTKRSPAMNRDPPTIHSYLYELCPAQIR